MQRRQQRISYPCFLHLAIRFTSAIFSLRTDRGWDGSCQVTGNNQRFYKLSQKRREPNLWRGQQGHLPLRDTPTLYNLLTWHNSHRAPWRWPSVCSTDRRCTEISEIEITTATIDQECELKTVLRFEDSNLGSQFCESISRNSKMLIRILLFSKWLDESKLGI